MADQALFSYRVQLPDGSETIRTGGADRPPTHGEIADYAANQGERYLGPVAMSPAQPPAEQPAPAVPPAAIPPRPDATGPLLPSAVVQTGDVAVPAPAPTPDTGPGVLRQTFLPERTFMSQVPEIAGAVTGGTIVGSVAPPLAPFGAGTGAGLAETGRIVTEQALGWPPAEPGTPGERVARAYARGATGEVVSVPLRAGVALAGRAVSPVLDAVEALRPVLTGTVDAAAKVAGIGVDDLLKAPTKIAARLGNWALTPEGQETLLTRWWRTAADGGPQKVVQAWDALGQEGQRAVAGASHTDMSTIVDTLRSVGKPPWEMSVTQAATSSTPAYLLYKAGHPALAATVGLGTHVAREQAPRLLLSPGPAELLSRLPQAGRVAAPWVTGSLRTAAQTGTALEWPSPLE